MPAAQLNIESRVEVQLEFRNLRNSSKSNRDALGPNRIGEFVRNLSSRASWNEELLVHFHMYSILLLPSMWPNS